MSLASLLFLLQLADSAFPCGRYTLSYGLEPFVQSDALSSPRARSLMTLLIDVAEGDKIPRKRGPGVTRSDLLVINKSDLAPYVRADLEVMQTDALAVRGGRPVVVTNCFTRRGIGSVLRCIAPVMRRFATMPDVPCR